MANALLLQQMAQGGINSPTDSFSTAAVRGEQIRNSQQSRQQNNALFQMKQQEYQRGMAEQEQQRQLQGMREDLASYLMAPEQAKPQLWARLAPKYGQDPNSDPNQIIPSFIQSNPGVLGPEVSQKVLEQHFAPKPQGLTNIAPGGVVFDQDMRRPIYTAPQNKPAASNRMLPTADAKSPTGFVYTAQDEAAGLPAPAPRSQQASARYSQKEMQSARDKLRLIESAQKQLATIKERAAGIKDSFSAGPLGNYVPTESGSRFDGAVDQIRDSITSITRTPGIGASSDFESRLSQAKLPSRGEYEATMGDKITGLENLLSGLQSSYKDILNGSQGGQAADAVDPQDILDAADAILNGGQ